MGGSCCSQNSQPPVQVIDPGDAKPAAPGEERPAGGDSSACTPPAAAVVSARGGGGGSASDLQVQPLQGRATSQGSAPVAAGASQSQVAQVAELAPTPTPASAALLAQEAAPAPALAAPSLALRRQSSLTVAAAEPPAPPPEASKDLNGSAVSALRQPNRKRSLRAGAIRPPALDVSSTTLRNAAGSTAAPCALWASLPAVAKDSSIVGSMPSSPAATRSSSHNERYDSLDSLHAEKRGSRGGLLPPRKSFAEGDDRETMQSFGGNLTGRTDRSRWDDSSLLEEAHE